jgi:hypothetical protein
MCVAGYCESNPSNGDGGIDAPITSGDGSPDATVPSGACGGLELLTDDFGDGTLVGYPWYGFDDTGVTLAESGGDFVVNIGAGSADVWGGNGSQAFYDFHETQIQTKIDALGGQDTVLEVRGAFDEKAQLVAEAGQLHAAVFNTGNDGDRAQVALDLPSQTYWRIREHQGRMYWEYSADRQSWTNLWDEPDPFAMDDVMGYLAAGGQLASASAARYADVNGQGTTESFCGASTLHEDFTGTELYPRYGSWNDPGTTVSQSGGDLVMTFDGSTGSNNFAGIETNHRYDLRDSEIVLDAKTIPTLAKFITYVSMSDSRVTGERDHLEIGLDYGDGTGSPSLYLEEASGATIIGQADVPYDATQMRYWRLRGAAGRLYIDTSPDGATWTNQLDAAAQIDLHEAKLTIGAGNYAFTSATTVRFGSIN